MKKKISKIVILTTAIILFVVSLTLLSVGLNTTINATKLKAKVSGNDVIVATNNDAHEILVYSNSKMELVVKEYSGEIRWVFNGNGIEEYTDNVNNIKVIENQIVVSLLNKRKVLFLDIKDGKLLKCFNINDPVSLINVDEKSEVLTVVGVQGTKNYLMFYDINEPSANYVEGEEIVTANTPVLNEMEFATKIVQIDFIGEKVFWGLKNGAIYSLPLNKITGEKTLFLNTKINLVSLSHFDNDVIVAISDKGQIIKYVNKTVVYDTDLSCDIYAVSANTEKGLIALGIRADKMKFFDVEKQKITFQFKKYNEPSYMSFENSSTLIVIEGYSSRIFMLDSDNLSNLCNFQVCNNVTIATTIVSTLYLIFAIFNSINKTSIKQKEIFAKIGKAIWKHKKSYLLLLPTFILLGIFNYFPTFWGLSLAFTKYQPGVYTRFVGFQNFVEMFHNQYFWQGTGNMMIFLVTDLIKVILPPILAAEIIFAIRSKKVQYWLRVSMYIPGIIPGIAGLMIWTTGILGMDGLINMILTNCGMGNLATDWLGNSATAIWSLVFIGFPYIGGYLLFYGALMGVPSSVFEAAKIDGCGWFKRIFLIDMPMIGPQLKFVLVTGFIGSIQDFARVWLTTEGKNNTYIPTLELYYNISIFNNYGVAAAMGLVLFVVIFCVTLINMRIKTQSDM